MRKVRENILVASGNQAIFGAGLDVFNGDGTVNVGAGQIVLWNPNTNQSLGAGITTVSNEVIVISVGKDEYALKSNFGDELHGCAVNSWGVSPPSCGTAEIKDLFFTCVDCDEVFGINVAITDNETENQYPFNRPANYTYTVRTDCCACDSCDTGIDSMELARLFANQISEGVMPSSPAQRSKFQAKRFGGSPQFTAHPIFGAADTGVDYTFEYCINPVKDACGGCIDADTALFGYSFDGGTTDVAFTNVLNSDGDATLMSRLHRVVDQLNDGLGDNGSAAIVAATGKCCSHVLQVNVDVDTLSSFDGDAFLWTDAGYSVALAPCDTSNPYAAAGAAGMDGGIRFIAKEVTYDCGCYPPNPPKGTFYRKLDVYPTNGFACGASSVVDVQDTTLPDNLGYVWQWREYASDNGGRGRGHDPFEHRAYGPIGLPLDRGPASNVSVDCNTSYCAYILEHDIPNSDIGVHGNLTGSRGRTVILIPAEDDVTLLEWEAIMNAYLATAACPSLASVTCGVMPIGEPGEDIDEGEQALDQAADVDVSASIGTIDCQGATLSYVLASSPAPSNVTVNTVNASTGAVNYTPTGTPWSFTIDIFCGLIDMGSVEISGTAV